MHGLRLFVETKKTGAITIGWQCVICARRVARRGTGGEKGVKTRQKERTVDLFENGFYRIRRQMRFERNNNYRRKCVLFREFERIKAKFQSVVHVFPISLKAIVIIIVVITSFVAFTRLSSIRVVLISIVVIVHYGLWHNRRRRRRRSRRRLCDFYCRFQTVTKFCRLSQLFWENKQYWTGATNGEIVCIS